MSGCGSSASTIAEGMTSPRKALATSSMPTITGRLREAGEGEREEQRVIAAKPLTATPITRGEPKRSPRRAANCEAPKKPTAFSAKARLKPVGDRPNWPV